MSSKRPRVQHMMVELKARVSDLAKVRDKLIQHDAEQVGVFHQIDTYYAVPKGRLKLREVEGEVDAELVYYERKNVPEPKRSHVFILQIPQVQTFKQVLKSIMKTKAVVDKVREVYFYKGVEIHLDIVKGLGSFVEFERATSEDSEQQRKDLLKLKNLGEQLDINLERLEGLSYCDLVGK